MHEAANRAGMLQNTFTDTMLGASAAEQLQKTKNARAEDLIYFCIVLFGTATELDDLTRKFSILKV